MRCAVVVDARLDSYRRAPYEGTNRSSLSERQSVGRLKNTAVLPSQPDRSRLGVRARLVAMAGVLRCLFAAPPVLPASPRILLSPNNRRTVNKSLYARRSSFQGARLLRILVIALRMVVSVTAVQISGVSHAVADVIVAVQGGDEYEHNCPNDNDGRECPPGCPSCHCTHAMNALPSVGPSFVLDALIPIEIAIAPYEAQSPPGPEPGALYRPPRSPRG